MYKKSFIILIALGLILFGLTACGNSNDAEDAKNGKDNIEEKGTLGLAMPSWVNSPPQAWMVKLIIEDNLGWDVEITEADIGLSYAATADGTTDFFVDCWMPSHQPFLDEHEGDIELLEPFTKNPPPGLVVPSYVDIDSIEELNANKDKFNGEIIGIEPGSGILDQTAEAIKAYGLDYDTVEGSDFAMTAALGDAIDFDEWIVVTGWKPHWKFIRYDLKFLEDPKKIYGESNTVYPVINKGLREKAPEVVDFLDKWEVDIAVWDEMIYDIAIDEKDVETVVREWLDDNQDLVDGWLK